MSSLIIKVTDFKPNLPPEKLFFNGYGVCLNLVVRNELQIDDLIFKCKFESGHLSPSDKTLYLDNPDEDFITTINGIDEIEFKSELEVEDIIEGLQEEYKEECYFLQDLTKDDLYQIWKAVQENKPNINNYIKEDRKNCIKIKD